MDLRSIAADVPNYQEFLTVDELNLSSGRLREQFPELVSTKEIGKTRNGEPIELLTIAGGEANAFVFGGPHPNEPIGCMTIEYLSRRLCEDESLRGELGYTWHFIKTIDADGMRLNEGWFKGPFSPTNYARHFYRPARAEQVEWTFPIEYKSLQFDDPLPETRALMQVIDETKPNCFTLCTMPALAASIITSRGHARRFMKLSTRFQSGSVWRLISASRR